MAKTNLGQFLYLVRMKRGFDNISDYLKNYSNLPISEPYYRDIESGRNKIKVDKAHKLCRALKLDASAFYYHLLTDVLPKEVLEDLFRSVAPRYKATLFSKPADESEQMGEKLSAYRRAYTGLLIKEPYIVSDSVVEYLQTNFDILPVIHFVYMRKKCTFSEIEQIRAMNNVSKSLAALMKDFEEHSIATVDRKEKVVRRFSPVFQLPRDAAGARVKSRFLMTETQKTLERTTAERGVGPGKTLTYSSIVSIKNGDSLDGISERLSDFLAEIEAENSSLDERDVVPYFVSLLFSSREEYNASERR